MQKTSGHTDAAPGISTSESWVNVVGHIDTDTEKQSAGESRVDIDLLERITDPFFAVDRHWRFTYLNQQTGALLNGRDRKELLDKNIWEEFPELVGTPVYENYHVAAKTGEVVHFEAFFSQLDTWFQVSCYPSEKGLSIFFRDVTQQKRAENSLRESEERSRMVWESAADAMMLSDPQGIILMANPAYYRLHGYTPEEIIGQGFATIIPQSQRSWAVEEYKVSFAAEQIAPSVETTIIAKDGTSHIVESRYTFVVHEGRRTAMLSIVRDITERRLLEQQKDDFITLASHELKTPVTSIKGFAELALRYAVGSKSPDERIVHSLHNVTDQTDRLIRLINQLLDVSRMQGVNPVADPQPVDLGNLAETTLSSFRLVAPSFTFVSGCPGGSTEPIVVKADRQLIERVMINLVDNAIKYSGESRRVEIAITQSDDEATVAVRDYGVGIPSGDRTRVFDRFYRATNTASQGRRGLGLGLYLCREIVTQHGGRISFDSTPEVGSTFYFSLPLANNNPT